MFKKCLLVFVFSAIAGLLCSLVVEINYNARARLLKQQIDVTKASLSNRELKIQLLEKRIQTLEEENTRLSIAEARAIRSRLEKTEVRASSDLKAVVSKFKDVAANVATPNGRILPDSVKVVPNMTDLILFGHSAVSPWRIHYQTDDGQWFSVTWKINADGSYKWDEPRRESGRTTSSDPPPK